MASRRRRHFIDTLGPSSTTHWVAVWTPYRALVQSSKLPPGTDLMRAFIGLLAQWADDGWKIGDFSSVNACFFCTKGHEKRCVQIISNDPSAPEPNLKGGSKPR